MSLHSKDGYIVHQHVSITIRDKLKCRKKCLYTYTYTFQVYHRSASMFVYTQPSVFTRWPYVLYRHLTKWWLYSIWDNAHSDTFETMWKMPLQLRKGTISSLPDQNSASTGQFSCSEWWCLEDSHESLLNLILQDTLDIGSTSLWSIFVSLLEYHFGHHIILFISIFIQPWNQQMVQALSMDKSYKYNSMQSLVHRDCY
jgi:hypothetical protein